MKNFLKSLLAVLLVIFLVYFTYWGSSILHCEYLTKKHGQEFQDLHKQNTMIGDIEKLKVIDYSDNFARVYYISKDKTAGNILTFKKNNNNKWEYFSWEETVWSSSGSADGFMWPYGR